MPSLTIGKKLYIGVGVLVGFTFALGTAALMSISSIGDSVHTSVDKSVKKQVLANGLDVEASELLSLDRAILVRGYMKDPAMAQKYNQ